MHASGVLRVIVRCSSLLLFAPLRLFLFAVITIVTVVVAIDRVLLILLLLIAVKVVLILCLTIFVIVGLRRSLYYQPVIGAITVVTTVV